MVLIQIESQNQRYSQLYLIKERKDIPPRIIKRMEVDPFQPGPPVSLQTPIALSKKNAQVFPRTYSL